MLFAHKNLLDHIGIFLFMMGVVVIQKILKAYFVSNLLSVRKLLFIKLFSFTFVTQIVTVQGVFVMITIGTDSYIFLVLKHLLLPFLKILF